MKTPPAHREPLGDEQQEESSFTPLTAEEARWLREQNPQISPWWVVGGQVASGALGALLAWTLSGRPDVGMSLLYGACAVAVPAALYARALARGVGAGFLLWELVKVGLTAALLAAAPKLVPGLSWLALLVGVILATKMYWVALAWMRRPRRIKN